MKDRLECVREYVNGTFDRIEDVETKRAAYSWQLKWSGPQAWVGLPHDLGPEVGLLGVLAMLLGTLVLVSLRHRASLAGAGDGRGQAPCIH